MSNNKHDAAYFNGGVDPTTPRLPSPNAIDKKERNRARNKKTLKTVAMFLPGLVLGIIIGVASNGSDKPDTTASVPTPVETVTITETIEVVDETCRTALNEVWDILAAMNGEVLAPLSQAASEGVMAAATYDSASMDAITQRILDINDVHTGLSNRVTAITPEFQECNQ